MAVTIISTSDKGANSMGSFEREVTRVGKLLFGRWMGYATVRAGVAAASLDILIPSQQRGMADTNSLILDANSRIISVGMRPLGVLTLGAANGRLKLAGSLNAATTTLYVESAAASGGNLALVPAVETINGSGSTATIGTSDVTYRIYATDGAAGAAAAASTITATKDTKILVEIAFWLPAPFPSEGTVGNAAPPVI